MGGLATFRRLNRRSAGEAMTKSELIAELAASNPHLRGADVELIVATIFDQITGALARGERVELRGFGAFTVKRRNARTGRNPRTGEAVPVDEAHYWISSTSFPNCSPDSMRRCASAASASGRTESTTGRQLPWLTTRSRPAKSLGLPIVVPRIECWPKSIG